MLKKRPVWFILAVFLVLCFSVLGGENSATIEGFVFFDSRADGSPEGAVRMAGISVALTDGNDQELASVTTDADGTFTFSGLTKGEYRIVAKLDNKHVASPMAEGGSRALPGE